MLRREVLSSSSEAERYGKSDLDLHSPTHSNFTRGELKIGRSLGRNRPSSLPDVPNTCSQRTCPSLYIGVRTGTSYYDGARLIHPMMFPKLPIFAILFAPKIPKSLQEKKKKKVVTFFFSLIWGDVYSLINSK